MLMNSTEKSTQQLLTVREVAEVLRVARHTVYDMIDRGDLEAVDLGGPRGGRLRRVTEESLHRLIARKKGKRPPIIRDKA
jgi:excisionase family DNA binding protein